MGGRLDCAIFIIGGEGEAQRLDSGLNAVTRLYVCIDVHVMDPEGESDSDLLPFEGFVSAFRLPARFEWKELYIETRGSLQVEFEDIQAFMEAMPACVSSYRSLEGQDLLYLVQEVHAWGYNSRIDRYCMLIRTLRMILTFPGTAA